MAIERITRIEGRARPLGGNDIDTDRIIPARFLRSVSFEGLETHLFEDDIVQARASNVTHPMVDARFDGAEILVVNRNFGCGSSREHARRRSGGEVSAQWWANRTQRSSSATPWRSACPASPVRRRRSRASRIW